LLQTGLALLLAGTLSAQDHKLKLVYAQAPGLSGSLDFIGAVESLIRENGSKIELEGIDLVPIYSAPSGYLHEFPSGTKKEDLPLGPLPVEGRATVLVGPRSALIAEPPADGLLADILRKARDRAEDVAYAAGASTRTAVVWRKGALAGFSLESRPSGRGWSVTVAMRYRLKVDGRPVVLIHGGRTQGGLERLSAGLGEALAPGSTPAVALAVSVGVPEILGIPKDAGLALFLRAGVRLVAMDFQDLEWTWNELAAYAREGKMTVIATNLKPKTPGSIPTVPYAIEEVAGVKIGILSLIPSYGASRVAAQGIPAEVQDPVDAAREAIRELQAEKKVDLIVAVSHLSDVEHAKLLDFAPGIGLMISETTGELTYASSKKTTVELSGWAGESHIRPFLNAHWPGHSVYEVGLTFRPSEFGLTPVRAEEVERPFSDELALGTEMESVLDWFLRPQGIALPDPRRVWPSTGTQKLVYAAPEFWNLAAVGVHRRLKTELALLRVNPLGSNVTGGLGPQFVQEWCKGQERLVIAELPGSALRGLLGRISVITPPIDETSRAKRRRYESETVLAVSGLSPDGRVGGLPLSDQEVYEAALSENLLLRVDELPQFAGVSTRAVSETLTDVVLAEVKDKPAEALRDPFAGRSPDALLWRLNLRELSVFFANTQVRDNEPFTQTRDARTRAIDQIFTQAAAKLFSEVYKGKWRWDAGLLADYSRLTLKPKGAPAVTNTTKDQWSLETEVRHRTWAIEAGRARLGLGPFANVAYETQFTDPIGVPRKQILRNKAGIKLFEGFVLKDLSLAAATETDYSFPTPRTQYGYAAGLTWEAPLPRTSAQAHFDASYLEFFLTHKDTAADLRRKLEANAKLTVPVWKTLALNPFVSYFLFQGKTFPTVGHHIQFGVSLSFNRLWKPIH
jgi:hypothetical protein